MSDEIREQLSALVDDELDKVERPLLLGRLQRDTGLREILGRYQLISEVMRGAGQAATLGIADRVKRALEQDAALPAADKSKTAGLSWLKPIAGLTVAASVALVAVLAVTSIREPAVETAPRVASTQNAAPATRGSEELWERIEPRIDKRMAAYLVNHNEYAASRGVQGVMPYVRIVGYENKRQ
jgi:sigma-E factor negative regulatory protein RseA